MIRTVHLNSECIVLLVNTRDKSQLYHFARQIEPNNSKQLAAAYVRSKERTLLSFSGRHETTDAQHAELQVKLAGGNGPAYLQRKRCVKIECIR